MNNFFILLLALLYVVSAFGYNINSGDVLHLEVYGERELSLDVTVDSYGFIDYPFAGKVEVKGKSVEDVKKSVTVLLKDGYFVSPQLTVFVKKYQPFFIQGEVTAPGSYDFESGMTIRKAIALAGGFTERASKKKIFLTRSNNKSQGEIKVSMDEKIESGDIVQIKESFF